jgi:hypothetical protein
MPSCKQTVQIESPTPNQEPQSSHLCRFSSSCSAFSVRSMLLAFRPRWMAASHVLSDWCSGSCATPRRAEIQVAIRAAFSQRQQVASVHCNNCRARVHHLRGSVPSFPWGRPAQLQISDMATPGPPKDYRSCLLCVIGASCAISFQLVQLLRSAPVRVPIAAVAPAALTRMRSRCYADGWRRERKRTDDAPCGHQTDFQAPA